MATSKLQIEVGDLLDRELPQYRIRENYRPEWLLSSNITKLEIDFFIEDLKIGIEVQGEQHYRFVPFFHKTQENYEKRRQYDVEKADLCSGNGVKLYEVFTMTDAIIIIKDIQKEYNVLPKKKDKRIKMGGQIFKDNTVLDNLTIETKNALIELKKWEFKAETIGKICVWHGVHLPENIVQAIFKGQITFRRAREILIKRG